jgi:hypothetical protein
MEAHRVLRGWVHKPVRLTLDDRTISGALESIDKKSLVIVASPSLRVIIPLSGASFRINCARGVPLVEIVLKGDYTVHVSGD